MCHGLTDIAACLLRTLGMRPLLGPPQLLRVRRVPGTFAPAAPGAAGPRPPGAPRFFVPGAAPSSAASAAWGQPSIPEAAAQLPEAVPSAWVQPAGGQAAAWGGANGAFSASMPPSIPEVPAVQDVYTSYADLQPSWPETAPAQAVPSFVGQPPPAFAQPGHGAAAAGRTQQGYQQDGELTEIQL